MKPPKPLDRQYLIFMLGVIFGSTVWAVMSYAMNNMDLGFVRYLMWLVGLYGLVVLYQVGRDALRMLREYQREDRWNG